jgi:hypothetical protein
MKNSIQGESADMKLECVKSSEWSRTTTELVDMRPDEAEHAPITVTAREAARLSGFGLTSIWAFIKDGRLKTRRVPGVDRTLILYSSLQALLTPDPSENTKTPPPRRPRGRPAKPCAPHVTVAASANPVTRCAP